MDDGVEKNDLISGVVTGGAGGGGREGGKGRGGLRAVRSSAASEYL